MISEDQNNPEKHEGPDAFQNKSKKERIEAIEKCFGMLKLTEDPVVMQRRWRDEWED